MKRCIFLLTVINICISIFSQNVDLKTANGLYAKGHWEDAAQMYEEIIKTQGVAPELYYNLGNAYYKMGETALSILNYERALRLAPAYRDAQHNLALAQTKIIDNVPQPTSFFVMRWVEKLMNLLSSNEWLYLGAGMLTVALVLMFFFLFNRRLVVRKLSFYTALLLLAFCVLSCIFAGVQKNRLLHHDAAIVINGIITVKSAPDKSGTDLFQLHEGTRVTITGTLDGWSEIRIGNGNVGWVESKVIEKI